MIRPPYTTTIQASEITGLSHGIILFLIEIGILHFRQIGGKKSIYSGDVPRLREFWIEYRNAEALRAGCPVLPAEHGRIFVF